MSSKRKDASGKSVDRQTGGAVVGQQDGRDAMDDDHRFVKRSELTRANVSATDEMPVALTSGEERSIRNTVTNS